MEVGNSNQRHRLPGGFFLLISEEQKKAAPFGAAFNYIEVRGSEKVEIVKKTSTVHTSRYANRPLQYLVIHYTAGGTSRKGTARNVASMFGNPANRDASADFIVDDAECVQFNGDIRNRYTYAVGYRETQGAVSSMGSAKISIPSALRSAPVAPTTTCGIQIPRTGILLMRR